MVSCRRQAQEFDSDFTGEKNKRMEMVRPVSSKVELVTIALHELEG